MAKPQFPLALYAAVTAAMGEGYTLAQTLEHQGLSEDAWDAGEEEWVDALDESAESDLSLFEEFDRALAAERARFARRIPPLDESLEAFLTFQRHFSAAERPVLWLSEHGLFLGDWVRLQELWAERFSEDGEVRALAASHLAAAELPAMPKVMPGPRNLPPPLRRPPPSPTTFVAPGESAEDDLPEWGLASLKIGVLKEETRTPLDAGTITAPPPAGDMAAPEVGVPPPAPPANLPTFMRSSPAISEMSDLTGPPVYSTNSFFHEPAPVSATPPSETLEDEDFTFVGASPVATVSGGSPLPFVAPRPPSRPDPRPHGAAGLPSAWARLVSPEPAKGSLPGPEPGAPPESAKPPAPPPVAPPPRAPPPVASPPAPSLADQQLAGLTLAQYAAICARIAVAPAEGERLFAMHGLTNLRARLHVDLAWQERLRLDPLAMAEWARLYAHYSAGWNQGK